MCGAGGVEEEGWGSEGWGWGRVVQFIKRGRAKTKDKIYTSWLNKILNQITFYDIHLELYYTVFSSINVNKINR